MDHALTDRRRGDFGADLLGKSNAMVDDFRG
jgi:hypothetical protein